MRLMKQFNVNAVRTLALPERPVLARPLRPLRPLRRRRGEHRVARLLRRALPRSALHERVRRARAEHGRARQEPPERHPLVARQRERLRPEPRRGGGLGARARPVAPAPLRGRDRARLVGRAHARPTSSARCTPSVDEIEAWARDDRRPAPADPLRVLARDGQLERRPRRLLRRVRAARRAPGRLHLGVGRPRHPARRRAAAASTGRTAATSATTPNDANFCADGLVWPDRTPHPALLRAEVPRPARRGRGTAAAAGSGSATAATSPTSPTCAATWELTVDGAVVRRGKLPPLDVPRGRQRSTSGSTWAARGRGERFVTFRFFLRRATDVGAGRPRGRLAAARAALAGGAAPRRRVSRAGPRGGRRDRARGGGTRAVVDARPGTLTELCRRRAAGTSSAPARRCSSGARRPTTTACGCCPSAAPACSRRWLELGLDRDRAPRSSRCGSRPAASTSCTRVSGRGRWDDAVHRQRYRLLDSGGLLVENDVRLGPELRDLPRVGVVLAARAGPRAARVVRPRAVGELPATGSPRPSSARFRSTVTDQYVPYILPQEHGHTSDVRRLSLTDETGFGLDGRGPADDRLHREPLHRRPTSTRRGTRATSSRGRRSCSASTTRSAGSAPPSCGPDTHPRYRLHRAPLPVLVRPRAAPSARTR